MFHETKPEINVPEEITERYDIKTNEDCSVVQNHINAATSAYSPIIFVDKEAMTLDISNTSDALTLLTMNNIRAVSDYNLVNFPFDYLYTLQESSQLTANAIIERIKEETLMSVMSFLDNVDSTTDNMFLKYFNLREKIDACIRPFNSIDQCIWDFFRGHPYSINKMEESDIQYTKEYIQICARNIMAAVIHELTLAVNYAIDDTIFRIHLIPNIMELKEHIIKQYRVPKEDMNDSRFWILANINIKDSLATAFNDSLYPVIMKNIYAIMESSVGSSYFVYNDAFTEKNEIERKKRVNGVNDKF